MAHSNPQGRLVITTELEKKFHQELVGKVNQVLLYEDFDLQNAALECIPLEQLSENASKKFSASGNNQIGEEVFLIHELLRWFKFSFFSWVDIPKCENCQNIPEKRDTVRSSPLEQQWGASRVEVYFCTSCQKEVRFPRYNHPKKLLETKRGRCGEWANCFTLFSRSLGYDTRLVVDWNDHVWTEIYSVSLKRWLHCDSCENLCDAPLVYEKGWKKKLNYVIAFSKDEIQDVTWRYTSDHKEVLKRRNLCREEWLLSCIMLFTEKLQAGSPPERKDELLLRKIDELAEFLTAREAKEVEQMGRISGSVAWRESRKEYNPRNNKTMYSFCLNENEINKKHFHIKYNCADDKYIRASDCSAETDNWETLTFEFNNIFRKIEHDWNMVYLARMEGTNEGSVTWRFNFKDSGLEIENVNLVYRSKIFSNGIIEWIINAQNQTIFLKDSECTTVSELKGLAEFSLTAKLKGGEGSVAWQHAQLFRQSLDSKECPFEVLVSLS